MQAQIVIVLLSSLLMRGNTMTQCPRKIRLFIHLKQKEYAKRVKKELRKLAGSKIAVFLDRESIHQLIETDKQTYEKIFGGKIELQIAHNKGAEGVEYWREVPHPHVPQPLKNLIDFVEVDRPLSVSLKN